MERQTLHVAVAVAPDLGLCIRASNERIVRGNFTVIVQTADLPMMIR